MRLECMDNIELMKEYPNGYFDLAIVDPPYGISINMNMGRKKGKRKNYEDKKWDDNVPSNFYFDELFRVSKNQIIWGGELLRFRANKALYFLGQANSTRVKF